MKTGSSLGETNK